MPWQVQGLGYNWSDSTPTAIHYFRLCFAKWQTCELNCLPLIAHTAEREKKRNSMKRRQNPKDKQCQIGGVADSEENTMSDDEEAPEKNKNKPWNHPGLFLSIKSLTRIHMAGLMKTASRSVLSAQVLGMYLLPANHGAAFIMNTRQMTSRQKFHSWQNECWRSRELWWQPCFDSSLRCFSNFSNFCKPNPLVVPVLEYYLCFLLH